VTEPLDRNKTDATHNVTRAVMRYLDERGFKPVETEVPVADGWVADIAGVCTPTRTEAVRLKLIPASPRCAAGEPYQRWNARYQALPCPLTALVEVKVSKSDFSGDHKWDKPSPANLRYLAIPHGLLLSAYPPGWTVLSVSNDGTVRIVASGDVCNVPADQKMLTILSIAVRRDHATRYQRLRGMMKQYRVTQGEQRTLSRMSDAIRMAFAVATGQSCGVVHATPEEAVRFHCSKPLPKYVMDEARRLWCIAKAEVK
jgi:hypothetical protein